MCLCTGTACGHSIDVRRGKKIFNNLSVGDVASLKTVSRIGLDIGEILRVASIRQGVEVDDLDIGVSVQLKPDKIGDNESTAAYHEEFFHHATVRQCALS